MGGKVRFIRAFWINVIEANYKLLSFKAKLVGFEKFFSLKRSTYKIKPSYIFLHSAYTVGVIERCFIVGKSSSSGCSSSSGAILA